MLIHFVFLVFLACLCWGCRGPQRDFRWGLRLPRAAAEEPRDLRHGRFERAAAAAAVAAAAGRRGTSVVDSSSGPRRPQAAAGAKTQNPSTTTKPEL